MINDKYEYTQHWFGSEDLVNILPVGTDKELHILEIGSFEGKSTVWFIENLIFHNKKSTITCVDPWLNYTQNEISLNTYSEKTQERPYDNTRVKKRFWNNVLVTDRVYQLNVIHGFSHEELPKLLVSKKEYDVIFIDGNHTSSFVLTDAIMSWYLLKKGGIMIFDDYNWRPEEKPTNRPKMAIDNFISNFAGYIDIAHDGYRKAIVKK